MFIGLWVENYEPLAWAEELIEPAQAVDHPRLGFLYVPASQCWNPGRIFEAVQYATDGQAVVLAGDYEVPFGAEGWLAGVHLILNQPDGWPILPLLWSNAATTRIPSPGRT